NATMLYGHIESFEDRVDHMIRLREQQDKSGGFQCFIPLAFYPPISQLSHLPGPSGVDSLKTMAVSRLMLDNFAHIKAYWVMLGKRLAQVALHFGANDVDGTITEGGELTESYSVESNNEVKMTKSEIGVVALARPIRRRFAEDDGGLASDARQLCAHQSVLGDARQTAGAGRAALRRERCRRDNY